MLSKAKQKNGVMDETLHPSEGRREREPLEAARPCKQQK